MERLLLTLRKEPIMALRKEEVLKTVRELFSENDREQTNALTVAERLGIDTEDDEQLGKLFAVLGSLLPEGIKFDQAGRDGVVYKLV